MEMTQIYRVKFICGAEDGYEYKAEFTADNPNDVQNIISAMAAYNSGDVCKCFINGEEAVLEGDWGLL